MSDHDLTKVRDLLYPGIVSVVMKFFGEPTKSGIKSDLVYEEGQLRFVLQSPEGHMIKGSVVKSVNEIEDNSYKEHFRPRLEAIARAFMDLL